MDAAARSLLQENLRRLGDGDRAAASAVFAALWPPCLQLASSLLRHPRFSADDAKDAAQGALVKLFSQAPSFDPARSGLGWALALVTWECRTLRKKRARSREDAVDAAALDGAGVAPVVDVGDRARDVEAVVAAFLTLDERDQQTLRALLDGEAAGDPAARKRRQRALDRLRALVLGPSSQGNDHG